jgi:hypothetical protein
MSVFPFKGVDNSSSVGVAPWWPAGNGEWYDLQTEYERFTKNGAMGDASYYGRAHDVYNSFSGADIVAYIHIPPQPIMGESVSGPAQQTAPVVGVLGNIQTLSYSTFREVEPVRSLSRTYADGYTRGPRTIAGTIVWTVLDQYVLAEALKFSGIDDKYEASSILIDQIPPFNVIITLGNEYGDVASMGIYGIRMVNEGSTFSIDDMITEQTNSFIAADIDLLHKGPPFRDNKTLPGLRCGTDVLMKEAQRRMDNHRSSLQ